MATVPASILGQIAKAKASMGGNLIRDGAYVHTVKRILLEKGFKGWSFKAELLVDEAQKVATVDAQGNPTTIEPNAKGSSASMVCNLSKNENAAGNVKAFICALVDVDENTVSAEDFAEALAALCNVDSKQPEYEKQLDTDGHPLVLDGAYVYTNKLVLDAEGKIVFMAVQPGRGRRIKCDTYQRVTKNGPNAGKIGTYPRWTHIAMTDDEINQRRAEIDRVGT